MKLAIGIYWDFLGKILYADIFFKGLYEHFFHLYEEKFVFSYPHFKYCTLFITIVFHFLKKQSAFFS